MTVLDSYSALWNYALNLENIIMSRQKKRYGLNGYYTVVYLPQKDLTKRIGLSRRAKALAIPIVKTKNYKKIYPMQECSKIAEPAGA
jgi:hypothetical protein